MQIAIIRRKFNPFGGAERFILRTIQGLQNTAVKITVIAEEWDQPTNNINPTFDLIPIQIPSGQRASKNRSFREAVHQELRLHSFDITQSHERMAGVDLCRLGDGLHAIWLERLATIRPWYQRWWLKLDPFHRDIVSQEQAMVRDPHLTFVANSPMVYEEMRSRYAIPEERIVLIENGIDLSQYSPSSGTEKLNQRTQLGIAPDAKTILYVGSGYDRKGAFELVRAMQYLPDHQLLVIGHDKKIKHLQGLVRQLKLDHRVYILGPQKDVQPYLKAADLFCLPSLYDSLPNALLEALASGLPAVITANVGIAEKVQSHGAGLISTREPLAIAQAIGEVSTQLVKMSERALDFVQAYDLQTKSQEWLQLYQHILLKKVQSSAHTAY